MAPSRLDRNDSDRHKFCTAMRTSFDELSVYYLRVNCFKGRKKKMDIQIELINLIIKIYPVTMYMYLHQEGTVEQNPKHAGVFTVRVIQILLNSVDSGETIQ